MTKRYTILHSSFPEFDVKPMNYNCRPAKIKITLPWNYVTIQYLFFKQRTTAKYLFFVLDGNESVCKEIAHSLNS